MQSALRIGRFGPLVARLHYTWLFVAVLCLWWLGLLWLPENLPGRSTPGYWALAVLILLCFVLSAVLHDLAHTLVARTGRRNLIIYPFGASSPFPVWGPEISPGRALAASLAGPVFSLALGGAMLILAGLPEGTEGLAGLLKAFLTPLGLLNIWLGFINLVPGIPFDGGWALGSALRWFSGDPETGINLGRRIGELATLAIALYGAWLGLTAQAWLDALALVVVAWAARAAEETGKHGALVHDALEELKARDFMDATRPADAVRETDTVAQMVKAHARYAPDVPLPVLDDKEELAGLVTLSTAEKLLQGDWPNTPVTALMSQPGEVLTLDPDISLTDVVALVERRPGSPSEQPAIPVLADGRLLGSVDPSRIEAFERVDLEFGEGELAAGTETRRGFLPWLGRVAPAVIVVVALAIMGNIALNTNPYDLRSIRYAGSDAPITFSDFIPADGAVTTGENLQVSVKMVSARTITTASVTLDDRLLEVQLSDTSPLNKTAIAPTGPLSPGTHKVRVTAATLGGQIYHTEWQFSTGEAAAVPTAEVPAARLEIASYIPARGSELLAGAKDVTLGVEVRAPEGAQGGDSGLKAQLSLDGNPLDVIITPVEGVQGRFLVSGVVPLVEAGQHTVKVHLESEQAGFYSAEWTFTATTPSANNVYFKETGFFVSQPFLNYWNEKGGLALFGYPISPRLRETDKATGEVYTSQYFERARFELHAATGEQVILGRLGALLMPSEAPTTGKADAQFFPETGHNLSGPFLAFWQKNGGLALFGYPITEERVEQNPLDGKEYTVQYFERARFELHPEFAGTAHEVQLGQLGTQLLKQRPGEE